MRRTFLHELYATTNQDLQSAFGTDSSVELENHFYRHGIGEIRGFNLVDHLNIEAVFCSDRGDVLLVGWADRRIIREIKVELQIGYFHYEVEDPNFVWYDRPDVAAVTGDHKTTAGFVALFRISDAILHP